MHLLSKKKNQGFTLLEIIIVIIIVGVLASLALPRLFSTVEFSKGSEALSTLSSIRQSMTRCGLMRGNSYTQCNTFANLDMDNPDGEPGAHFTYSLGTPTEFAFTIVATRNTWDGGDGDSTVTLSQSSTEVEKSGAGAFGGI